MDGDIHTNPFLSGNYAPIRSEDDFDQEVIGELPTALRGTLYRIGPNPQFEPRDPNYHWFTGDGMVHALHVADGKVSYRNRYVRTPKWELEAQHGRSLFAGFNPLKSDPLALGRDSGVANTNIVFHGGKLLALEEAHQPFEMAQGSLDSRGYVAGYEGRVTAHPKIDPRTGQMVWFGYGAGPTPLSAGVSYGVTDASGHVTRSSIFQTPYASMVHDFMVTENYVLFPILPLTGSLERAMSGRPPYAWEPELGGHVGVMRRDADVSTIRWYSVASCYVFHPMNAWEEDGRIVADVFRYDTPPAFTYPDGSPVAPSSARLTRWTLDLAEGSTTVREAALDDLDGEFPRFDERFAGRAYRHGWFAGDTRGARSVSLNAVVHLDLRTGRRAYYELPAGDLTSEPVFIPRSPTALEGDGWLTAVVWRAAEARTDLLVFEARMWPRARSPRPGCRGASHSASTATGSRMRRRLGEAPAHRP